MRESTLTLGFIIVLNRVTPQRKANEVEDAKSYLAEYPEFELAETSSSLTKAWAYRTVWLQAGECAVESIRQSKS